MISMSEIETVPENLKEELVVVTGVEDMDDLFALLDRDGSGYIDIEEFIEALNDIVSSQISVETFRLMKSIFANRDHIERNSLEILDVKETCEKIVNLLAETRGIQIKNQHTDRGGPSAGYKL